MWAGQLCLPLWDSSGIILPVYLPGTVAEGALVVMRQSLSPMYLNTNGRHAGGAYGEGVDVGTTARASSRQTVPSKAGSQISPTFFSLISPVVVEFEVGIVSLLYRRQSQKLTEAHHLHLFLAVWQCLFQIQTCLSWKEKMLIFFIKTTLFLGLGIYIILRSLINALLMLWKIKA